VVDRLKDLDDDPAPSRMLSSNLPQLDDNILIGYEAQGLKPGPIRPNTHFEQQGIPSERFAGLGERRRRCAPDLAG
jgi:hypothetical protein